jgi:hypothetical protein
MAERVRHGRVLLPETVRVYDVRDRLLIQTCLYEAQEQVVIAHRVWNVDDNFSDQDIQILRQAQVLEGAARPKMSLVDLRFLAADLGMFTVS